MAFRVALSYVCLYYMHQTITIIQVSVNNFTFGVNRRRREMYIAHARLCLSVCLSVPRRMPSLRHGPGCNLGE